MGGAPPPHNEAERLEALKKLRVLDSEPEEAFDRLVELAIECCDVPIALISLVDESRQWFKARVGLDARQTPREHAFCGWAVHEDALLEVNDALADPRFSDNPLVQGEPKIRFYAGAPLRTDHGALGTLCVIDQKPRALTRPQRQMLEKLAAVATNTLRLRQSAMESARRARLLELAEQLADVGHWRVDARSGEIFWSPQVFRIHGIEPKNFVPVVKTGLDAYHPDDRERVAECVRRAIEEGIPYDFQLRLLRTDGETRIVRSLGFPERDEQDQVVGIFGVFQDLTEQRRMQERLVHAEKLATVGTLAAGVAHEINNPLSYIWSNAHVLSEELASLIESAPSPRLRELAEIVDDVKDGARRIDRIVGGLKTFSQAAPESVEVVDLANAVVVTQKMLREDLQRTATFALEPVTGDSVRVLANEPQLVQVLANLLSNAVHAFEGHGNNSGANNTKNTIVVRIGHNDRMGFVEIEDNAGGMPADVARQAFTPFYTTKPPGIGTGLGLSICHGIVTGYGGTIDLESTPGVGTKIRVSLPTEASRPPAAADEADAPADFDAPLETKPRPSG